MLLINTTDNGKYSIHSTDYSSLRTNYLKNRTKSMIYFLSKSVKKSDDSTYGVPSPPHSLAISAHSATYVTISWQPPEYSHLHETISYQ